jgi:hypothetical protein
LAKPQNKTQKKIDNNIRLALTSVCEQALKDVHGFKWLTYEANYTNFLASLFVTGVFDSEENLKKAADESNTQRLRQQIQASLLKVGVIFKTLNQQVCFDSEEACALMHSGDWKTRLACRKNRAAARNRL